MKEQNMIQYSKKFYIMLQYTILIYNLIQNITFCDANNLSHEPEGLYPLLCKADTDIRPSYITAPYTMSIVYIFHTI